MRHIFNVLILVIIFTLQKVLFDDKRLFFFEPRRKSLADLQFDATLYSMHNISSISNMTFILIF